MSSSAASTTHPRDIHDRMAKNYFGVPQNMANLLEQTLPAKVCKRLDLSSLEPTGETFITGEYEKYIADLVKRAVKPLPSGGGYKAPLVSKLKSPQTYI